MNRAEEIANKAAQIAEISARLAQPSRRMHNQLVMRLEQGLAEGWMTEGTERAVRAMIARDVAEAAKFGWRENRVKL